MDTENVIAGNSDAEDSFVGDKKLTAVGHKVSTGNTREYPLSNPSRDSCVILMGRRVQLDAPSPAQPESSE